MIVRWFTPHTPVSSTNKTYLHHITDRLLKLVSNTINQSIHLFGQVYMFVKPPNKFDSIIDKNTHKIKSHFYIWWHQGLSAGSDPGGAHPVRAPPPLKLEKIWFFGVKSWFFTRNTPKIFAPPSARRHFLKCAPLTWNPGSAPGL